MQENSYVAHVHARPASDGLAGVLVSDAEYPVRVSFSLLNKLLDEFLLKVPKTDYSQKVNAIVAGSVEGPPKGEGVVPAARFPPMADYVARYQDPRQADAIMKVQQELDETKIVLVSTDKAPGGSASRLRKGKGPSSCMETDGERRAASDELTFLALLPSFPPPTRLPAYLPTAQDDRIGPCPWGAPRLPRGAIRNAPGQLKDVLQNCKAAEQLLYRHVESPLARKQVRRGGEGEGVFWGFDS